LELGKAGLAGFRRHSVKSLLAFDLRPEHNPDPLKQIKVLIESINLSEQVDDPDRIRINNTLFGFSPEADLGPEM